MYHRNNPCALEIIKNIIQGAIIARFVIEDSSICLINCHLAAGQHHVRQRNADVAAILEGAVFPVTRSAEDAVQYAGGGDGSMIFDHEIVLVSKIV
jgi:hypothetical protein